MKPIIGWTVHHPYSFACAPIRADDLVSEIRNIWADFDWPDLFESQVKAWGVAKEYLTEILGQALEDLEFWTNRFILANGVLKIYHFPPGVAESHAEVARKKLEIAKAGLALCPNLS